jgi:predicted AAA+ superfamily ATPase
MVTMEIKRSIYNKLCDDLNDDRALLLIGARQVGKTFLMKKLRDEAAGRGWKTSFWDLEQPSDSRLFGRRIDEIVKMIATGGRAVFIDEFHYLENASQIIKSIYDSEARVKIVASGSSAMEIHRHLKESLAGRKIVRRIHPCSAGEILSSGRRAALGDYLIYGGMPGLVGFTGRVRKQELLADIFQSYILKDIRGLVREENVRAFNMLVYLLAERQGSLVSASGLANEIGVTARTVEGYLETLALTYVASPLHSYSNNLGHELKKSRKVFLYDLGIRNAVLKDFRTTAERPDGGAVVESFVYLELARQLGPADDLRFWRTKAGDEVDFVWIANRVPIPIEVKTADVSGSVPRGLRMFVRRYPKTKRAFVLHGGERGATDLDGVEIRYLPWREAASVPEELGA